KKLIDWSRAKDVQKHGLDIRMFFYARYGNLARHGRVMRIIKNSQTGGLLRLGVDAQQNLVRKLVPSGCDRLPKSKVKDISVGIIGDSDRSHRFLPAFPKDLVSRDNEIVLRTISGKTEANYHDDSRVALGQITVVR